MIIHDTRKVECSECQSADVEHVTYHNSKFMRCRKCGHEGTKTNLMPPMSTESAGGIYTMNDEPLKF